MCSCSCFATVVPVGEVSVVLRSLSIGYAETLAAQDAKERIQARGCSQPGWRAGGAWFFFVIVAVVVVTAVLRLVVVAVWVVLKAWVTMMTLVLVRTSNIYKEQPPIGLDFGSGKSEGGRGSGKGFGGRTISD